MSRLFIKFILKNKIRVLKLKKLQILKNIFVKTILALSNFDKKLISNKIKL